MQGSIIHNVRTHINNLSDEGYESEIGQYIDSNLIINFREVYYSTSRIIENELSLEDLEEIYCFIISDYIERLRKTKTNEEIEKLKKNYKEYHKSNIASCMIDIKRFHFSQYLGVIKFNGHIKMFDKVREFFNGDIYQLDMFSTIEKAENALDSLISSVFHFSEYKMQKEINEFRKRTFPYLKVLREIIENITELEYELIYKRMRRLDLDSEKNLKTIKRVANFFGYSTRYFKIYPKEFKENRADFEDILLGEWYERNYVDFQNNDIEEYDFYTLIRDSCIQDFLKTKTKKKKKQIMEDFANAILDYAVGDIDCMTKITVIEIDKTKAYEEINDIKSEYVVVYDLCGFYIYADYGLFNRKFEIDRTKKLLT